MGNLKEFKYMDLLDSSKYLSWNKGHLKNFTWIGKPNFLTKKRDFGILRKNSDNTFYLDIWNEYLDENFLIKIDPEISKDDFINLVNRYVKDRIAPEVGEVPVLHLHRFKMEAHRHYKSPVCVKDDEKGWHKKTMIYGHINSIIEFENSLLFNIALCKTILRQMTAYYNNGDPLTTIETRYSGSIAEFQYRSKDKIIVAILYYIGDNIDDIPIDVKKCIHDYGKIML